MTFCIIHCVRKSSRIIVKPTTRVNVLWDAIVPLSATPTTIDRPFAKHQKSLSFRTHQWCFLTSAIHDTQAYIRKRILHLGKGIFFVFFLLLILHFSVLIELFLLQYCFRHCAFWLRNYYLSSFKKNPSMILDLLGESTGHVQQLISSI